MYGQGVRCAAKVNMERVVRGGGGEVPMRRESVGVGEGNGYGNGIGEIV
ncbi:MAG: hypothetical protein XU15_C0016G0017 [candidate division NC10 bacterium CSP1-5]|nr:MAG: hypothetical protein XU15_C0016G0017 [candidate division NC10 bacterium CSP1-5]